jgi:hypothetical protein
MIYDYLWGDVLQTTKGRDFIYYYLKWEKRATLLNRENRLSRPRDDATISSLFAAIWKTVARHFVENEAGVYIRNLGYFCHLAHTELTHQKWVQGTPGRKLDIPVVHRSGRNWHKLLLREKRKGHYYFLVDTFHRDVNREVYIKMRAGNTYRFLWRDVQAYKKSRPARRLKIIAEETKYGAPCRYSRGVNLRNPLWRHYEKSGKKRRLLQYGTTNPLVTEEMTAQKSAQYIRNFRLRRAFRYGKIPEGYENIWEK